MVLLSRLGLNQREESRNVGKALLFSISGYFSEIT